MSRCPVCDSSNQIFFLSFQGFAYKLCPNCSLVFLDTAEAASPIYDRDYIKKRGHDAAASNIVKAKELTADYYLSLLERFSQKEKLLEIGCSTGLVLKAAEKRGWDIHGVEVNRSAIAVARERFGVNTIKSGPLSLEMFPPDFFSAVMMLDVLEHIHDPRAVMKNINIILKPGGSIMLITPNIMSLSAKLLKSRWPHLFLEHICLYSPKSIRYLLESNGYKIIRMGWAIKFVSASMVRAHLSCHPKIFFSGPLIQMFDRLKIMGDLIFPFNIGEMYVLAKKI